MTTTFDPLQKYAATKLQSTRFRNPLIFLCALILSTVSFWYLYQLQNELILKVTVNPEQATTVQVYFTEGRTFTEESVHTVQLAAGKEQTVSFTLPQDTQQVRLDPAMNNNRVLLSQLALGRRASGTASSAFTTCVKAEHQSTVTSISEAHMTILTSGADPQLLITPDCIPPELAASKELLVIILQVVALALLGTVLTYFIWSTRDVSVPILLSATFGVITFQVLLVSLFSNFNAHPDEFGHVLASSYFQHRWFEGPVDSPEMVATLMQNWGSTYLNLNDMVYFLAEKTTSFLSVSGMEDYTRYRLFNFVLFPVLLVIFAARYQKGIWFLVALGISSQTWYLFSYFNGDALGMFFCLLLGFWYVTNQSEIDNQFLTRHAVNPTITIFSLLCVAVFFCRLNYAAFVFFIFGIIFMKPVASFDLRAAFRTSIRLSAFAVLIAIPAALHELASEYTNDFRKAERIEAVKDTYRDPQFSKQHILETGNNPYRLFLRETGTSYIELLTESNWLHASFRSFFGVYGYMDVSAPENFYLISSIFGAGLLLVYLLVSAAISDNYFRFVVGLFFVSVVLVIFQSTIYSWTFAFQSQGRYSMAVIPMFAVALSLVPRQPSGTTTTFFLLLLALVNLYGFSVYGVLPMLS